MLGFLLGWGWRIRSLRKKWDRTREKTLKKKGQARKAALERLDTIENNLRLLEETKLTRLDRIRLSGEVETGINEVREFLKAKQDKEGRQTQ
ncbi:MAG: hypothetical protein HY518_05915 [Candidatus Aenigmarchaeota archaeon]|nr:hypothetical protein [Candidatus Aenigmarchaeota archaeon]